MRQENYFVTVDGITYELMTVLESNVKALRSTNTSDFEIRNIMSSKLAAYDRLEHVILDDEHLGQYDEITLEELYVQEIIEYRNTVCASDLPYIDLLVEDDSLLDINVVYNLLAEYDSEYADRYIEAVVAEHIKKSLVA